MTGRVTCIGGAVIDMIYDVDTLPGTDGKYVVHSVSESGGGMAANAAVMACRLGGRATWCGRVGDDDKGRRILDGLRHEGVRVDACKIFPGVASSHSVVVNDAAGDRAILLYQMEGVSEDPSWLSLDRLLEADVVLADNRWLPGAQALLQAARDRGLPRVLDIDSAGQGDAMAFVALGSHAIYSDPGLSALFDGPDSETRLRQAVEHSPFVAVTKGAGGVDWMTGDKVLRHVPAFPITVQESVGAGDVFHGAFALCLAEGTDEEAALRFASAAAALKCARTGGRASFPRRSEVEALCRSTDPQEGDDHG